MRQRLLVERVVVAAADLDEEGADATRQGERASMQPSHLDRDDEAIVGHLVPDVRLRAVGRYLDVNQIVQFSKRAHGARDV